jgi:hypothetical protein
MSHINDALKRAQEAQQENPPTTPPLEFRPVEPDQQPPRRSTTLMVGLSLVIVAILGLSSLLVYFISQSDSSTLQVAARVIDPPLAPLAAVSNAPAEPKTNMVIDVAAAVVNPPAPMKLQGIFFNPKNPSALVNGQSVNLGDRVGGFRVMGISPVAVTLVSATATNVLSLSVR